MCVKVGFCPGAFPSCRQRASKHLLGLWQIGKPWGAALPAERPERRERATHLPVGDHEGHWVPPLGEVSCLLPLPATLMTHRLPFHKQTSSSPAGDQQ